MLKHLRPRDRSTLEFALRADKPVTAPAATVARLQARGLLDADGRLTSGGRHLVTFEFEEEARRRRATDWAAGRTQMPFRKAESFGEAASLLMREGAQLPPLTDETHALVVESSAIIWEAFRAARCELIALREQVRTLQDAAATATA